ncbi:MAG TPA: 1-deoxy-D-xylulose-5-phosphate reductoisomerase [Gammaproteobacteria bacterium]|nr:1-deoxy-D-xylulose-5-phosphate reductoisomerase [Gammaproteobacteria bacterium]
MKGICILGATGSIGVSTLDVVARHTDRYRVVALTANRQVERLAAQCQQYRPDYAVMADADAAERLATILHDTAPETRVLSGVAGLCEVVALENVDAVMAAIVGAAGLAPTIAAARAGKRILLANKEALVMSGNLFMAEVRATGAELLPIDSEHNAIFQCMPTDFARGLAAVGVTRILLTASGGPFRDMSLERMQGVTPDEACAHPNWSMGRKISVDSATMMNKGLEVIEAAWLFNTDHEHIEVVLHPQSIIHSLVRYVDGSVLAQMGNPDMRTPIAHALAWPERIDAGVAPLDLIAVSRLDFQKPDLARFPCLRLAFEAAKVGGSASTVLNAANEVAVEYFLSGKIAFTSIAPVIEQVLSNIPATELVTLEKVMETDMIAREEARQVIEMHHRKVV